MTRHKPGRGSGIAVAVLAAAVLGACAPTGAAVDDTGRLYSFAELEQHVAERIRAAGADQAVAVAKAKALARLARAYLALQRRSGDVVAPSSLGGGPLCYTHRGKPAGACLDI